MLRSLFVRLWNDQSGAILSAEYLMLSTIVVAGGAAGMAQMRDTMNGEFREVSEGARDLRRSYMPAAARPATTPAPAPAAGGPMVAQNPGVLPAQQVAQASNPSFAVP